jgi:hypothetical protein
VSESKRGEKGFGSSDAIDQDMFKQLECFSEVLVDNKPARLE